MGLLYFTCDERSVCKVIWNETSVINDSDIISYLLNKVLNFSYTNTGKHKFVLVQAMKVYGK